MRPGLRTILTATALGLLASEPARAQDGKALYEANCAKCHGATGQADTPAGKALKAPALLDAQLAGADGPARVKQIVRENPKHKMVSTTLSDEQLAAVAEFVRTLAAGSGG